MCHLLYGNPKKPFDTSQYVFGKDAGSTIGHAICNFTMTSKHSVAFFFVPIRSGDRIMAMCHMAPHTTNVPPAAGAGTSLPPSLSFTSHTMFSVQSHLRLNTLNLRRCQCIFNRMPNFLAPDVTTRTIISMHHSLLSPIRLLRDH
eukprot:4105233-Ditylum_brightwellii.AAC.1